MAGEMVEETASDINNQVREAKFLAKTTRGICLLKFCIDLSTLLFALILNGFQKIKYQNPSNNVSV